MGKPVYHKFTDLTYGSWLKDALPKNDDVGEKIWTTNESDTLHVYEYANKAKYRNNIPKIHRLKPPGFRVSRRERAKKTFEAKLKMVYDGDVGLDSVESTL